MIEIEVNKTIFQVFMDFSKKFLIKSYLYLTDCSNHFWFNYSEASNAQSPGGVTEEGSLAPQQDAHIL